MENQLPWKGFNMWTDKLMRNVSLTDMKGTKYCSRRMLWLIILCIVAQKDLSRHMVFFFFLRNLQA